MAQAPRKTSASKRATSRAAQSRPSDEEKPESGEDWQPETVEPGSPDDSAKDEAENDQEGPQDDDQPEDGAEDETEQNKAAEGDTESDGVVGLNPIPEEEQKRFTEGASDEDLDVPPPNAVVVEDISDVQFEGEENDRGEIVPDQDIVLKAWPMGSKRPTYILLFKGGLPIPKAKTEAFKARAANETKNDDSEDDKSEEKSED